VRSSAAALPRCSAPASSEKRYSPQAPSTSIGGSSLPPIVTVELGMLRSVDRA